MSGRRRIHSPPVRAQLRGVAVSLLPSTPRSTAFPNNRSPLNSDHLEPPSMAWSPFVPPAHVDSSRPRRQDFFPAQHLLSWPGFKESVNLLLYARHDFSRTALLKAFESRIIDPPKTSAVLSSCSSTHNLITNQRTPRSLKRAGAETTLRTTWIERHILHRFCLDNPQAGGGSKQFPEAAVVRGG